MRKIIIATMALITFASCKKDAIVAPQPVVPTKPVLVKSPTNNYKVKPGTGLLISAQKFTVGDMNNFAMQPSFTIASTISFAELRNFYFAILRTDLSVVFTSDVTSTQETLQWQGFIDLPKGTTYILACYADAVAGADGQVVVTTSFDYTWTGTDGYGQSDQTGQSIGQTVTISPYGTLPAFEWSEITGVVLQDSVATPLYRCYVTNPGPDTVSLPQFTYALNLLDVGNNDNIKVINLWFMVNHVDVTGDILFTHANGVPTTYFTEADTKTYIPFQNGTRDIKMPPGARYELLFGGTPVGLNHNGNQISSQLLVHDAVYIDPGHLNVVSPTARNLKITPTVGGSTGGVIVNFPFGTVGQSFSAIPGGSTASFTGGNGIPDLPVQYLNQ